MHNVQVDHTRSFALIGHAGDGKTSLGESLLHVAGATRELGRVTDGSSVLNHLPEENDGHHTHSITSHLFAFDWHDNHFTLIDTPGDPNFQGDGELALQAVDGAVLVLDAVEGARSGTSRMLHFAEARGIPLLAFVNGLDRERADLDAAIESLSTLDVTPVLLSIPVGSEANLEGIVDLIDMTCHGVAEVDGPLPEQISETARRFHEACVEAVAEHDDELLEKYLETGDLSREDIIGGLARGVRNHQILPVLCGSAQAELGVDLMLRELEELLPAAAEHGEWAASDLDGDAAIAVKADPEAPFSAVVFKTILDRYAGTLSVMRVVSGTLRPDSTVLNATRGHKSRVGKLLMPQGERHVETDEAVPGDVVAVAKLKDVHTGDVLTCEKHGVHLQELEMPEGVISYAIRATRRADEDKAFASLARLAEEDPALRIGREPSTGEFLLSGRGELHIRTTIHRLERLFNVSVELQTPKVPYRETITQPVRHVEGKLKKQSGGAGMFGVCYLDLEPRPRGAGIDFANRVVGGAIPRGLIPAVEKGVREACASGPLAGYPVVDVLATCVDGKHHSVDSNEMAFKLAGSFALKAAVAAAKPVLLEPHMSVEISLPADGVGDVMGDLASRRGTVLGTETVGNEAHVTASVPMAEMLEYASVLTSLTGGKGEFHMHLSHYDELSPKLASKVIEAAKKEKEA
jgi:elongation factor G